MLIDYDWIRARVAEAKAYKQKCDEEYNETTSSIINIFGNLEEMMKEMAEKVDVSKEDIVKFIHHELNNLKRRQEVEKENKHRASLNVKFYTYTYNKDVPNMIKYHNKMCEEEIEAIDKMSEDNEGVTIQAVGFDKDDKPTDEKRAKGEGGLLLMSDIIKDRYESRKTYIKLTLENQ